MTTSEYLRIASSLALACVLTACGSDRSSSTSSAASVPAAPTAPSEQQQLALDFSTSRTSAVAGDSVVLEWRSLEAESCVASGDWEGTRARIGNQMQALPQARVYTFTLTCKAGNASVSKTVQVDVTNPPPKPVSLSAEEIEIQKVFKLIQSFDKV